MFSSQQMGHELLPIVIDVEASGFGAGSYPIEVGFVLPDGTPHCRLIKPFSHWTRWDESAESLHNISREILAKKGGEPEAVCRWLNEHLRGSTVYSDAWGNDMSWLGRLFDEVEMPMLFHVEAITKLLTEAHMGEWATTRQAVIDRVNVQRHRASNDARIIQMTYYYSVKAKTAIVGGTKFNQSLAENNA